MSHNTSIIGDRSEAIVLARYVALGFDVSIPFGDHSRYDLIVDKGGPLLRVQVKTATPRPNGSIWFNTASRLHGSNGRKTYAGDVDLFAVYCDERSEVYEVPIGEVPNGCEMTLRIEPTANGQTTGVNWASSYVLRRAA